MTNPITTQTAAAGQNSGTIDARCESCGNIQRHTRINHLWHECDRCGQQSKTAGLTTRLSLKIMGVL